MIEVRRYEHAIDGSATRAGDVDEIVVAAPYFHLEVLSQPNTDDPPEERGAEVWFTLDVPGSEPLRVFLSSASHITIRVEGPEAAACREDKRAEHDSGDEDVRP